MLARMPSFTWTNSAGRIVLGKYDLCLHLTFFMRHKLHALEYFVVSTGPLGIGGPTTSGSIFFGTLEWKSAMRQSLGSVFNKYHECYGWRAVRSSESSRARLDGGERVATA